MTSQHTSAPARTLTLGIDLTTAGARTPVHTRPGAAASSAVVLGDVVDYLTLARDAAADFVVFGSEFRLDDAQRPDAWLDPALIASRLVSAGLPEDTPRLVPALPAGRLDPLLLADAIAGIHDRSGLRGGWQLTGSATSAGVHQEVRRSWTNTVGSEQPLLVVTLRSTADAASVARHADVVRVRASTLDEARQIRQAVRSGAVAAGRDADAVRVVVDAITVIGQDAASALFRADLLRDLSDEGDADRLIVAGTAAGVAEELARWQAEGAVDGFVLIPGSLPTDAVAIAQELAPELFSRGLVAPSPARTAERARVAQGAVRAGRGGALVFAD